MLPLLAILLALPLAAQVTARAGADERTWPLVLTAGDVGLRGGVGGPVSFTVRGVVRSIWLDWCGPCEVGSRWLWVNGAPLPAALWTQRSGNYFEVAAGALRIGDRVEIRYP
jgi:hypothetical protein